MADGSKWAITEVLQMGKGEIRSLSILWVPTHVNRASVGTWWPNCYTALSNWHSGLGAGTATGSAFPSSLEAALNCCTNRIKTSMIVGTAWDGPSLKDPSRASQEQLGCSLFPSICKHRARGPQRSCQPCLRSFAQQHQIQLTHLFSGVVFRLFKQHNSRADLDKTQIRYQNIHHHHHLFQAEAHLPYLIPLASPKEQHK